MKTIISILTFVFLQAQFAKTQEATNFSFTTIQGNTFNLYNELEQGKVVVLDFFSISCGPCSSGIPVIEQVWQNSGANGNKLQVFGIECYASSNADLEAFVIGNGGSFQCFSVEQSSQLLIDYEIESVPSYFVISPDKTVKKCAVQDVQTLVDYFTNTMSSSNANDNTGEINILQQKEAVKISYNFATPINLTLEVYSILGNKIKTFQKNEKNGYFEFRKNDYRSGCYVVRIFQNGILKYVRKIYL